MGPWRRQAAGVGSVVGYVVKEVITWGFVARQEPRRPPATTQPPANRTRGRGSLIMGGLRKLHSASVVYARNRHLDRVWKQWEAKIPPGHGLLVSMSYWTFAGQIQTVHYGHGLGTGKRPIDVNAVRPDRDTRPSLLPTNGSQVLRWRYFWLKPEFPQSKPSTEPGEKAKPAPKRYEQRPPVSDLQDFVGGA